MHYWASPIEARLCAGQEVALVGAGNSAGQAAVYLASQVRKVWLLARGGSLEATMSRYLVERIEAQPNVEVLTETEIDGAGRRRTALEAVRWRNRDGGGDRAPDPAISSCSSAPTPTPTGWRTAASRSTTRASFSPARDGAAARCWRPAAPASSPSAMCAPARSSAWRPPSAKAPRWWRPCTPISREPATQASAAELARRI